MATNLELGELIWRISGDTADIKKKLNETTKQTNGLGSTFKKFAAIAGGALATIGIAKLSKELLQAASAAEETRNKFNIVFQDVADGARQSSADLVESYGLSQQASEKFLSNVGDITSGLGANAEEALKAADTIVKLGVDIDSFANLSGGAEQSVKALTGLFTGEREAAKALGIVINENNLKQYAEDSGLVFKELTALEKGFLSLELAAKQSELSLGDFANSQGSFANQSRIAQARVEDLKVSLGNNLLPVAGLAVKTFNGLAVEALDSAQALNQFVTSVEGSEKIGDVLGGIAGSIGAAFALITPIVDTLVTALGDALSPLKDINTVGEDTSAIFLVLGGAFQVLSSAITIAGKILKFIITDFKNFINIIIESSQIVGDFFGLLTGKVKFDDFKNSVAEAGSAVKDLFVDRVVGIADIVKTTVDEVAGFFEGTKELSDTTADAFIKNQEAIAAAVRDSLQAQQEAKEESNEIELETEEERLAALAELQAAALEKELENNQKRLESVENYVSMATAAYSSLASSITSLASGVTNLLLVEVDDRLKAELKANGLSEKSAVENAQIKLDTAIEEGDAETIDKAKQELKRTQIEEKFEKEKARIAYQGALVKWGLDLASAIATAPLATINAINTGYGAGFPVGLALGPALGAVAGTATAIQIGAIASQKPQAPRFQDGGVVPGSSFSGDQILARVNSGELILNREQQAETLLNIANGQTQAGNQQSILNLQINLDGEILAKNSASYFNRGVVVIDLERAGT